MEGPADEYVSYSDLSSPTWSLIVFPETGEGVPVVSDIGLGVTLILVLAAGAFWFGKRQQPAA